MSGPPLELEFALTCNVQGCGERAHYYSSVKRVNQGSDELHEVFTLFSCDKHTFIVRRGPVVLVEPKPWMFKSLFDGGLLPEGCKVWDATSGMRCVEDGCKYEATSDMRCPIHQTVLR